MNSKTLGHWREGNQALEATVYWRIFKGRQKISGSKWRFRFKIQLKRHLSPAKLWSSQNRFNIRLKVNLSLTKLCGSQYPVSEFPVQKELISRKFEFSDKLMVTKENLLPWCMVQKHGYPALRLILLWSLGGFLLIGQSYQYPLDRRNAKIYMVTWGLPIQT